MMKSARASPAQPVCFSRLTTILRSELKANEICMNAMQCTHQCKSPSDTTTQAHLRDCVNSTPYMVLSSAMHTRSSTLPAQAPRRQPFPLGMAGTRPASITR